MRENYPPLPLRRKTFFFAGTLRRKTVCSHCLHKIASRDLKKATCMNTWPVLISFFPYACMSRTFLIKKSYMHDVGIPFYMHACVHASFNIRRQAVTEMICLYILSIDRSSQLDHIRDLIFNLPDVCIEPFRSYVRCRVRSIATTGRSTTCMQLDQIPFYRHVAYGIIINRYP